MWLLVSVEEALHNYECGTTLEYATTVPEPTAPRDGQFYLMSSAPDVGSGQDIYDSALNELIRLRATQLLLDTHGSEVCVQKDPSRYSVWLWNNGEQSFHNTIYRNLASGKPGRDNVRWTLRKCEDGPYPSTFYIISEKHGAFLDTHGSEVWLWN